MLSEMTLTLFRAGGGGAHCAPPPLPQVNFLKYLKNALSYRVETFWLLKWTNFQKKHLVFNCLRPPVVTIATPKFDGCFRTTYFNSFHAKSPQNSKVFCYIYEGCPKWICCESLGLTRSLPRAILTFHHPGGGISDSEGRDGSFIVRRIQSAVPRDQKVTNSRHMMVPKLRFSRGLKAKAPGAVTACVPGPLRRRSLKFLQARRPRLAQEPTMGKVTINFFYLRGSLKCMIVILPTFWHSAPAWDFSWQLTRNVSLATMLVHSHRRSLDKGYGKGSGHCEFKRRGLRSQRKCGHFPPRRSRH